MIRRFALTLCLFAIAVSIARPSSAQPPAPRPGIGAIDGVVTAQSGAIHLGGVQIIVHDARNQEIATALSEGDGRFHVGALPEGKYTITATLEGFAIGKMTAVVAPGRNAEVF